MTKIGEQFKNLSFDPGEQVHRSLHLGHPGHHLQHHHGGRAPSTSWDAMFDEKYAGNVLMIRNSRDALAAALLDLGY